MPSTSPFCRHGMSSLLYSVHIILSQSLNYTAHSFCASPHARALRTPQPPNEPLFLVMLVTSARQMYSWRRHLWTFSLPPPLHIALPTRLLPLPSFHMIVGFTCGCRPNAFHPHAVALGSFFWHGGWFTTPAALCRPHTCSVLSLSHLSDEWDDTTSIRSPAASE